MPPVHRLLHITLDTTVQDAKNPEVSGLSGNPPHQLMKASKRRGGVGLKGEVRPPPPPGFLAPYRRRERYSVVCSGRWRS